MYSSNAFKFRCRWFGDCSCMQCSAPGNLVSRELHILRTCVGGCFIGGGFKIPHFAQNNMADSIVVTHTQLAITCFLKPPPLKPPPKQVPMFTLRATLAPAFLRSAEPEGMVSKPAAYISCIFPRL